MKRRWILFVLTAVGLAAVVGIVGFTQIELAALQEPGRFETVLATGVKRFLIRWSSREDIPPPPTNLGSSVEEGRKRYATDCSMCHGLDGRTPTDTGRWMSPRAADLTGLEVQRYSDRELFWIIKNGIRLSGMPAFGKVESDEHIWNLVHHVRALGAGGGVPPENGGATP